LTGGAAAPPPPASRGPGPEAGRRLGAADRLACWIAALGPCGVLPVAPASWASLAVAAAYVALPAWGAGADALAVAATAAVGIWAAERAERVWGHDASHIVVDEGAGMAVTLFLLPPGLAAAAAAFVAFRVFDILKPFPARQAERLPGGLGVMADDLLAGVYANLAARLGLWLLARPG
jgi:phosphatidylglycerophosphatase A